MLYSLSLLPPTPCRFLPSLTSPCLSSSIQRLAPPAFALAEAHCLWGWQAEFSLADLLLLPFHILSTLLRLLCWPWKLDGSVPWMPFIHSLQLRPHPPSDCFCLGLIFFYRGQEQQTREDGRLQEHFQICTDNLKFWVLWTHHRGLFLGEDLDGIWGTSCQTDRLTSGLQGKRSSMGSLQTELCIVWNTCGDAVSEAGCTTEAAPSTVTADFRFLWISHPLYQKGDTSLCDPHIGSLISMQCSFWQHIHFNCFSAMTLTVHEFREATRFLTGVLPLNAFKNSCHVFLSLAAHYLSCLLALLISILHPIFGTP